MQGQKAQHKWEPLNQDALHKTEWSFQCPAANGGKQNVHENGLLI